MYAEWLIARQDNLCNDPPFIFQTNVGCCVLMMLVHVNIWMRNLRSHVSTSAIPPAKSFSILSQYRFLHIIKGANIANAKDTHVIVVDRPKGHPQPFHLLVLLIYKRLYRKYSQIFPNVCRIYIRDWFCQSYVFEDHHNCGVFKVLNLPSVLTTGIRMRSVHQVSGINGPANQAEQRSFNRQLPAQVELLCPRQTTQLNQRNYWKAACLISRKKRLKILFLTRGKRVTIMTM